MNATGHKLDSFLPLQLLGQLYGAKGERPALITLTGAVLLVDVSRYTSLVETSSHRGQAGLEGIPKALSRSYARCVEQTVSLGGEVVRFTGDSFLAFWPDTHGGKSQAVAQARHCAMAICQGLHSGESETAADDFSAFHAGIGFGEFRVAAIGGNPGWNLVASGEAFHQASNALSQAGAGEYLMSAEAREALNIFTNGASLDQSTRFTLHLLPDEAWLRGFLPFQIRGEAFSPGHLQLDAGVLPDTGLRFDTLAEIRPMTILFGRVPLYPVGGHLDLPKLQKLCSGIQEVLQKYGGPAGDFFFDEQGLVCLTAFGASGTYHRDDPQRAVDAALEISDVAGTHGMTASIGVATGDAMFQMVGSTQHLEPMLFGQPVNRAARLMTHADKSVLCDSQTQRVARRHYQFEERGSLQLPGLREVIPVFHPIARQSKASAQSSLIGRKPELQFLDTAFDDVQAGSKRLVAVIGEPGIGKTTLVNAFADRLTSGHVSVSISRAERDDRRTSLLVWRRMLGALAGFSDEGDGVALLGFVKDHLGGATSLLERLPLLGDVFSLDIPDTEQTTHLQGAHRADATMRFLAELIGHLAPRPFVMVLEDCQWMDSASWRLLEWVLGSLDSLLVVLCVRVGEVPEQLKALQTRAGEIDLEDTMEAQDLARFYRVLEVMELDDASVRLLIRRTLDGTLPHDDVAQRIASLADGNPLFVEEISLSLKNDGLIALRDGNWQSIQPLNELNYFEGVEKVIRERVDQLEFDAQSVLKTASVIGRTFDIRPLAALLSQNVQPILNRLTEAQLILPNGDGTLYQFRHDQIRDVVYTAISSEQRRRLHGAMAKWLEAELSTRGGGDIAALVQHFEAAGAVDSAVKYADLAATQALRIGAYREVEAFVDICLEHEPSVREQAQQDVLRSVRWRRQLAEAHYGRGDIQAQGVAIRKALKAAGQKVPESRPAIIAHLAGRGVRVLARQALPFSDAPRTVSESVRWDAEIARCLNQAATVDYFQLRFTRGMCNLLGAVLRSEKTGVSIETVLSNCQLAAGLGMMGWRSLNARMMSRAERVAILLDDPSMQSHVYTLDALWRLGFCEWDEVGRRLDQAQAKALQAGDQLRWCNAQGIRFWSQYYQGDLSALEETSRLLLLRSQNAGNIQQEIWALRCKALCLLHIERPREAVDILRLTKSSMSGSVDLAAQISANGALALAQARIGQHAQSIDVAVETIRLIDKMQRPSSHSVIVGISSVLEVLLRSREAGFSEGYDAWISWEDKALAKMHQYSKVFAVGKAQFGLWSGVRQWLDGHYDGARARWQQAGKQAKLLRLRKDATLIAAEIRRREGQSC